MEWTTACPDWEQRIIEKQSLIPIEPLFPEMAEDALNAFDELKVVDLIGQPTMGKVTRDWARDFAAAVFGAYRPPVGEFDPGEQLINQFFLLISKKNTKSTLAAAIMLTALIRNERGDAEFLILAPTKEAADNAFKPARSMVNADDELKALFRVSEHTKTIEHRVTRATLRVIAADTNTLVGNKATGVLIDELHEFGKKADAESLFTEATGGLTSRPEGFVIWLSTQSSESPAGEFLKKLLYARAVRDGEIVDKKFLPVLYEFPQELLDDNAHLDPANFYVTNPNLGASVNVGYLEQKYSEAQYSGQDSVHDFLAKHLNVQIGVKLRTRQWNGTRYWERQTDNALTLADIIDQSDVITIGGDGGGLDDLMGFTALGRHKETRKWLSWSHAWVHDDVLELRKEIAPRLQDLADNGELTIIENSGDDCRGFAAICKQIYDSGKFSFIGLDPLKRGILLESCVEAGIPEEFIIGIPQGYKLASYAEITERKLSEGVLWHANQPLMDWCVGNAQAEVKGNNTLITKQASGKSKIDPLIALFNACAVMVENPEPNNKTSVYETRGIRMIG